MPRRSVPARRLAIIALGLYVGWTVVITPALGPVAPWVWLGALLLLAVTGLRGSRLHRSAAPLLLIAFWVLWAALLPVTTSWAPGSSGVLREVWALASGALVSVTLVLLSGGDPRSLRAFEAMWLLIFLTTLALAVWEVTTGNHLLVTRDRVWVAPARSPAATFVNPNNYACLLVLVIGLVLQRLSLSVPRAWRLVLLGCGGAAVGLILLAASRAALLAVSAQVVVAAVLWSVRSGRATKVRNWVGAHRLLTAAGCFTLATGLVATFTVPRLAALNPVLRILRPPDEAVAASDNLRQALTKVGLQYFWGSPWTGTGAGSFESLLNRQRPGSVFLVTNMHNAFVELLSQYGLLVTAPFVLLLLVLTWRVVADLPQPGPGRVVQRRAGRVDRAGLRAELACLLIAIVTAGLTVSSALSWALWWVMIAHATVLGWVLSSPVTYFARAPRASQGPNLDRPRDETTSPAPVPA